MYNNPWLYDIESSHSDLNHDLDFWRWMLERVQPRRVLELACGTGRVTIPLAEHGLALRRDFQIVGLDLSESFLDRAQKRVETLEPNIASATTLKLGDMANFSLDGKFDLVFISVNSLMHLHQIEHQLSCLQAVRRHLAPGGTFAFDILVPPHVFLGESQRRPVPILKDLDFAVPEQGIARFMRLMTHEYDSLRQTDRVTLFYELKYEDGRHERYMDDTEFHMYFAKELELLVRCSGFQLDAQYGAYDRSPFHARSARYLWVMKESQETFQVPIDQAGRVCGSL